MASFPVSTAASPVRNAKEKRLGIRRKTTCLSATDGPERKKTLERHRRKSMNELFNTLLSLLPHPVPKTDQVSILHEVIKYIPVARTKLEHLKKAKDLLPKGSISSTKDDMDPRLNDSKINAAIKVDSNKVDIAVWRMHKWVPLSEILNELDMQGLELINCSSFIKETKFFHHVNAKCLDVSVMSWDSLRRALQRTGSAPFPET